MKLEKLIRNRWIEESYPLYLHLSKYQLIKFLVKFIKEVILKKISGKLKLKMQQIKKCQKDKNKKL